MASLDTPLQSVAMVLVVGMALFLIVLPVMFCFAPARGERFLRTFASTARAHFLEQGIRLLFGSALVVLSPVMRWPEVIGALGWTIVGTSLALIVLPWRWHHRFASWVMPTVIRTMTLYGVGIFIFGAALLFAIFDGPAASEG